MKPAFEIVMTRETETGTMYVVRLNNQFGQYAISSYVSPDGKAMTKYHQGKLDYIMKIWRQTYPNRYV